MSPPKELTASVSLPRPRYMTRSDAVFLADASKGLAASLDVDLTLGSMADLSIPELGTACLVCLLSDAMYVTQVIARHVDPDCEELLQMLTRTAALRNDSSWQTPLIGVASSARPTLLSQFAVTHLLAERGTSIDVPAGLRLGAGLLVPVTLKGRVLAVVAFLSDRTRFYGRRQIRLADELTSRFAFALEAALAHQACKAALEDTRESLATALHDVMSPLTSIKCTAQRLHRIDERVTDVATRTELNSSMELIDSAANRMASALTALMQTARPQAAPWPRGSTKLTDLAILARRTVAEQQVLAKQNPIVIEGSPATLMGAWNSDQLERMLWNLIGNAVKYSPTGGSIVVSLASESDAEGYWAVVRVSDRGVGIRQGDLPFVVQPFWRGSNVGDIDGTGLGLASVARTVRTYDGRLWIDSKEGEGTRVTVRLPLRPPPYFGYTQTLR
jgi:signal transduction histidine kinase